MKKYKGITDHLIIPDNQPKPKKAPTDGLPGEKFKTVTIRIDTTIYGRFKAFCTKEGSNQMEVASEAIAYWVLFLAREAKSEGVEQAGEDWEKIRMKRILNRKTTYKERVMFSRLSWTRMFPGKPWPGLKMAATSQKEGDVQIEMDI